MPQAGNPFIGAYIPCRRRPPTYRNFDRIRLSDCGVI